MLHIDNTKCTGCGTCIQVCNQEAISIKGDKAVIAQWLCVECGSCLMACPASAIDQIKRPVTAPRRTVSNALHVSRLSDFRRERLVAAPMSLAPTALGILSGLGRKWLSLGGYRSTIAGARLGRGTGRCHRWRGRRC